MSEHRDFEELYEANASGLRQSLTRRGFGQDVDDHLQEAWLIVWRKREVVLGHVHPGRLIRRIARDKAIDRSRSEAREPVARAVPVEQHHHRNSQDAWAPIELREVLRIGQELQDDKAEIFREYMVEGRTSGEVGDRLGRSPHGLRREAREIRALLRRVGTVTKLLVAGVLSLRSSAALAARAAVVRYRKRRVMLVGRGLTAALSTVGAAAITAAVWMVGLSTAPPAAGEPPPAQLDRQALSSPEVPVDVVGWTRQPASRRRDDVTRTAQPALAPPDEGRHLPRPTRLPKSVASDMLLVAPELQTNASGNAQHAAPLTPSGRVALGPQQLDRRVSQASTPLRTGTLTSEVELYQAARTSLQVGEPGRALVLIEPLVQTGAARTLRADFALLYLDALADDRQWHALARASQEQLAEPEMEPWRDRILVHIGTATGQIEGCAVVDDVLAEFSRRERRRVRQRCEALRQGTQ